MSLQYTQTEVWGVPTLGSEDLNFSAVAEAGLHSNVGLRRLLQGHPDIISSIILRFRPGPGTSSGVSWWLCEAASCLLGFSSEGFANEQRHLHTQVDEHEHWTCMLTTEGCEAEDYSFYGQHLKTSHAVGFSVPFISSTSVLTFVSNKISFHKNTTEVTHMQNTHLDFLGC